MPDTTDIPTELVLAPMVDIDPNAWPLRFTYGTIRQVMPPGAANRRGAAVASAVVDLANGNTVIEEHDYADYAKRFSPRPDSYVRRAEQAAISRVNELNLHHAAAYQQPLEAAMLLEVIKFLENPEVLKTLEWTYLRTASGSYEVLDDHGDAIMHDGKRVTVPDEAAMIACSTFHRALLARRYREITANA